MCDACQHASGDESPLEGVEAAECRSGNRLSSQKSHKNPVLLPSAFTVSREETPLTTKLIHLQNITQHVLQIWLSLSSSAVQVLSKSTANGFERLTALPSWVCTFHVNHSHKTYCISDSWQMKHESFLRIGHSDMHPKLIDTVMFRHTIMLTVSAMLQSRFTLLV